MAPQKKKPTAKATSTTAPSARVKTGRVAKTSARVTPVGAPPPSTSARRSSRIATRAAAETRGTPKVADSDTSAPVPQKGRSKKVTANPSPDDTPAAAPRKGRSKKATTNATAVVDPVNAPPEAIRTTRSKTLASRCSPDATPPAASRAKKQFARNTAGAGPSTLTKSKTSTSRSTGGVAKSKATVSQAPAAVVVLDQPTARVTAIPKPSVSLKTRGSKKSSPSVHVQLAGDREITHSEDDLVKAVAETGVEGSTNAESYNGSTSTNTMGTATLEGNSAASIHQETEAETPAREEPEALGNDRGSKEPTVPIAQTPSAKSLGKRPVVSNPSLGEKSVGYEVHRTVPAIQTPSATSLGKRSRKPDWSPEEGSSTKRIRLGGETPINPLRGEDEGSRTSIQCMHTIHPAYANTQHYTSEECPNCRMSTCISDMQAVHKCLAALGGSVAYFEDCKVSGRNLKRTYEPLVTGQARNKKRKYVFQDSTGKDLSYRHISKRLFNLVLELEFLSKLEVRWGKQPAAQAQETDEMEVHGVKAALNRYDDLVATGSFDRVAELDHVASRKRGRDDEVNVLNYYDEENEAFIAWETNYQSPLGNSLPGAPERPDGWWITHDLEVQSVQETDRLAAQMLRQPTRKRRRMNSTVTFKNVVHVRTESDIDVLRKADLARPVVAPSASILRTAPPSGEESLSVPTAQRSVPHHFPIPLQDNKTSTSNLISFTRRRDKTRTEPSGNFWSELIEPGKHMLETSGTKMSCRTWKRYSKALEEEAARWDLLDIEDAIIQDEEEDSSSKG
ncbi:hypothetical protein J1614_009540 [Plenodomus biglobosus]|nr:hypothetical protein J1614_009540 [Plenodomus biglobosus]